MSETETQRASREMWDGIATNPELLATFRSFVERAEQTEPIPDDFNAFRVEIRDAKGEWSPAWRLSEPRYDLDNAWRKGEGAFLSVAVWRPRWGHWINWPAEDVRDASDD